MITLTKCATGALYQPGYVEPVDPVKKELLALNWITKRTARHEYFMSLILPRQYTYGGGGMQDQTYEAKHFTVWCHRIMIDLNRDLDANLNVCFLNKYDDAHQHLGWHADDFPGMDETQPIAVVSFGTEREIWVKPKKCSGCDGSGSVGISGQTAETFEYGGLCGECGGSGQNKGEVPKDQRILLQDGSLFVMPAGYQATHLHRIPKHDRPCGWRISLTFRSFK